MNRVPPHDMTVERAALGCAILENDCVEEMEPLLRATDFYKDGHGVIWEAILQLHRKATPIDMTELRAQLLQTKNLDQVGGDDYLLQLTDTIPTVHAARGYARRISRLASVRSYINRGYEVAASGYGEIEDLDEWLDATEALMASPVERLGTTQSVGFAEVIDATFDALQKQAESGSSMVGVPTGIKKLDRTLRGLAPGHLVICAGRPGMGKTAFGLGAAMASGAHTAIFSLEMFREQLGRRAISSVARVDGHKIRGAKGLNREEWQRLTEAGGKLTELPLHFWDKPGTTIEEVVRECRRIDRELKAQGDEDGLQLVLVDYLQLVETRPSDKGRRRFDTREAEVAYISKALKNLAKELRLCVFCLAQLNRALEARPNKRPMMSDLRESGAVEQDADVILFLYREEVYHPFDPTSGKPDNRGIAEIIIAKNREGEVGIVKCHWAKVYTTYENLQEEPEDAPPAPDDWHADN